MRNQTLLTHWFRSISVVWGSKHLALELLKIQSFGSLRWVWWIEHSNLHVGSQNLIVGKEIKEGWSSWTKLSKLTSMEELWGRLTGTSFLWKVMRNKVPKIIIFFPYLQTSNKELVLLHLVRVKKSCTMQTYMTINMTKCWGQSGS